MVYRTNLQENKKYKIQGKIQDKAESQNGYVASSSHVEFINGLNVVEGTPREKYFFNKSIEPYNCNMYKEVSENDIYYSNQEDE